MHYFNKVFSKFFFSYLIGRKEVPKKWLLNGLPFLLFYQHFTTNAFLRDKVYSVCVFLVWVLTYFVPFLPSIRCTLLFLLSFANSASFYILIWCSQNLHRGLSFYRLKYKWIIHEYNPGKSLLWRKVVFITYFINNYEQFLIKGILANVL